ncbi:hypothetical protein B0H11DRAFT_1913346 [Mycena galericulata]|nr:hypothetical protein B0H11DRAFT_1913346 [Mycena galericulata]
MQVRLLSPGVAIRFHDTEPVFSLRVYGVLNRCCSSSPFSGYPVGDDVDDTLAGAALEESMSLPSGLVLNGRAPRATRKTLRRIGTADARILRFFKPPPPSNSTCKCLQATPCTANPSPLHPPASLEHPASLLVEVSTGASPPSLAIISPILRALPFPIVHNLADSPYFSPSNSSFEPDLQGLARQHLPRPPHPSTRTTRATNTAPRRCPRLPARIQSGVRRRSYTRRNIHLQSYSGLRWRAGYMHETRRGGSLRSVCGSRHDGRMSDSARSSPMLVLGIGVAWRGHAKKKWWRAFSHTGDLGENSCKSARARCGALRAEMPVWARGVNLLRSVGTEIAPSLRCTSAHHHACRPSRPRCGARICGRKWANAVSAEYALDFVAPSTHEFLPAPCFVLPAHEQISEYSTCIQNLRTPQMIRLSCVDNRSAGDLRGPEIIRES